VRRKPPLDKPDDRRENWKSVDGVGRPPREGERRYIQADGMCKRTGNLFLFGKGTEFSGSFERKSKIQRDLNQKRLRTEYEHSAESITREAGK